MCKNSNDLEHFSPVDNTTLTNLNFCDLMPIVSFSIGDMQMASGVTDSDCYKDSSKNPLL